MKVWLYTSAAIDHITGKHANPEEGVQVHGLKDCESCKHVSVASFQLRPLISSHSHREK